MSEPRSKANSPTDPMAAKYLEHIVGLNEEISILKERMPCRGLTCIREMAVAARDGRKSQTRRVVEPQPDDRCKLYAGVFDGAGVGLYQTCASLESILQPGGILPEHLNYRKCPYGKPGDRLYVREEYYQFGHWEEVPGALTKGGRQKWKFVPEGSGGVSFDPPASFRKGRHAADPYTRAWHKRLARFMPKKYARTVLEIVSVRVERLQDISPRDCLAEGIAVSRCGCEVCSVGSAICPADGSEMIMAYRNLWESIHGPDSWKANPYVWVVEFKRVEGGQD